MNDIGPKTERTEGEKMFRGCMKRHMTPADREAMSSRRECTGGCYSIRRRTPIYHVRPAMYGTPLCCTMIYNHEGSEYDQ
jgi:hypothetical protein